MATRPRRLRPFGSIARRTCAAGVQAARRRPGPSGPHSNIVRHPPRADHGRDRPPRRASPSARRRSRRRTTGVWRRNWPPGIRLREERAMGRSGSLDDAFPCTSWMRRPPPAAHPIRHAGGRGDGQRAAGAGTGGRHRPREARSATQHGQPKASPGAPAPRACRLRVGIPAKWALADVLGFTACEYRTPSIGRPRADHGRSAPTPIAHPHPHAGGRGDGARAARSALCNPTPAAGGYRPAQPRHGRAGCARHRGEVAAHRLSWTQCPPPAAHPHPRAGGRGDGQRRGGPERADGTSRSLLRRAGTRV
jgi:hypothetical protein